MSGPYAHLTGVSGGEVLAATYADLDHLAATYAHSGLRLLGWSRLPAATLADPELLASAVFAPVSFGHVEAALTLTLMGRDGLPTVAAEWEALAAAVRSARLIIEAADSGEVQRLWLDTKEALLLEQPDRPGVDRGELAIAGLAGLIVTGMGADRVEAWSGALSHLYGPETDALTTRVPVAVGGAPPRDVADLVAHLGPLSEAPDGTIEVQTLVDAGGTRRHIVYLPGTDDMNPLSSDGQVRDMQENVRLVGDRDTAYVAGVHAALHQAGVQPDEPVLVTGHSQGGMVAQALAAHPSPYHVTNVVTFGSPETEASFPAGVHALSLEHDGDLVPQLAGVAAPSAQHVTVHFDSGTEGVVGNHSYEHYTAGAEALDASTDPDITTNVATLAGFFTPGQEVRAQAFQITRAGR